MQKQVKDSNSNSPRNIAKGSVPMIVKDDIIANADEGGILRFTLSLWELEHPEIPAENEATQLLGISKPAFTQHCQGHGSIGPEGWMKLAKSFDLRAYDIWYESRVKQYRRDNA